MAKGDVNQINFPIKPNNGIAGAIFELSFGNGLRRRIFDDIVYPVKIAAKFLKLLPQV